MLKGDLGYEPICKKLLFKRAAFRRIWDDCCRDCALDYTAFGVNVALSGAEVLIAVLSTYVLAFVQAGSSVFNQIEEWGRAKSIGAHFISIYACTWRVICSIVACRLCGRR